MQFLDNIDPVLWNLTLSGVAAAEGIAIVVLAVCLYKMAKHRLWRDSKGKIISVGSIKPAKTKPLAKVKADVVGDTMSIPGKGSVQVPVEKPVVEEQLP